MANITRTEAVNISVEKWSLAAEGKPVNGMKCGFCVYYRIPHTRIPLCLAGCPLFPDICGTKAHGKLLYWKWKSTNSMEHAKKMLEIIRERGKAWIAAEHLCINT